MHTVEREILVQAPVSKTYNQWTQFEEFPRFMEGVVEVRQLDDRHLYWRVDVMGHEAEWEAVIDEQEPDTRIEWHTTSGRNVRGAVRFEPWDMGVTKVLVEMEYDVDGFGEAVADALGVVERRVEGDLERFRDFVESVPQETGAWREDLAEQPPVDERRVAEERQRAPGASSAPGGGPIVEDTGEVHS